MRRNDQGQRAASPDCVRTRDLWHELRDGLLNTERERSIARGFIETHQAGCAECAEYLDQMDNVTAGLDWLRAESESATPPMRVVRRVRWRIVAQIAVGVAAAALLALFIRLPASPPATVSTESSAESSEATTAATMATSGPIELTGSSAEQFMSIERPTSHANVRIIELLPRVRSAESDNTEGRAEDVEALVARADINRRYPHAIR